MHAHAVVMTSYLRLCDVVTLNRRQSYVILTSLPAGISPPLTDDLNPQIYFLDQCVWCQRTEPLIPHETQTDVIGQTARMLRLFHEHI